MKHVDGALGNPLDDAALFELAVGVDVDDASVVADDDLVAGFEVGRSSADFRRTSWPGR